jgi:Acetyltransferase (GNAT) family
MYGMDKSRIIALYDQDQRKSIEYPGMRRESTPDVVRHIDTSANGEGVISYCELNEFKADDAIHEQVAFYEGIYQAFEWKVYDYDRPPDLIERLRAKGFVIEEAEALMVLDLDDAPPVLWQPFRHTVKRITEVEKLSEVQIVEQQVWNEDSTWVFDYLGVALRNFPDQMSIYVASIDGQPASAAWIFFPKHSQFASLWGGSTINNYRKHGLYTALLSVRAQEAKTRQVRYLTVDASPMSRPILEKFGFELIAYSYPCKWRSKSMT